MLKAAEKIKGTPVPLERLREVVDEAAIREVCSFIFILRAKSRGKKLKYSSQPLTLKYLAIKLLCILQKKTKKFGFTIH